MPILTNFHGKKFDVILIEDDGAGKGKCVFMSGTGRWRDGCLFLYRGANFPEFPIPDESLKDIRPIVPEMKGILEGPDYSLVLQVEPVERCEVASSHPRQLAATEALAF